MWHMDTLATVCNADPQLLLATAHKLVDLTDPASTTAGIECKYHLLPVGRVGHGWLQSHVRDRAAIGKLNQGNAQVSSIHDARLRRRVRQAALRPQGQRAAGSMA